MLFTRPRPPILRPVTMVTTTVKPGPTSPGWERLPQGLTRTGTAVLQESPAVRTCQQFHKVSVTHWKP